MDVRSFQPEDAAETAQLISKTLKISNSKDYSAEYIKEIIASYSAEALLEKARDSHIYVACDGSKIIGCGAIASYCGSTEESILLMFFVLPEYQFKGIGRRIMQTLERDEYFLRAKRIELHASITAVEFYKKLGYNYKNGVEKLTDELLYRLEKFR